jgi:hypothetical protein
MKSAIRPFLILSFLLPATASAAPDRKLAAMTPETFRAATRTIDDPLEFDAILSTERAYRRGKAAKGTVGSDAWLRAVVDRQTGAARYEVWQAISYYGPRRSYRTAHYATAGGVERTPLALVRHDADMCPNVEVMGDCVLNKTAVFAVSEAQLRHVASRYRAGGTEPWRFKLKDDGGLDVVNMIMPAEAAGLLLAVVDYGARRASPADRATAAAAH